MFSKGLEDLIQATLEDGILEDYEKAALVKRAQAEGVDLTELEIYINSILQKRKKEHDKVEDTKMEKIEQEKNKALRKCPNCGKSIPVMAIVCPACGYELSNQKAVSSVQTLADKIEKISTKLNVEGKVTEITDDKKDAINEEIIYAISLFPVPNSKQDIIEFLALACSKAKYRGGLWGTITGRLKLYVIITLIIAFVGVIVGLIINNEDAWMGVISAIIVFLVYGGFAFFLGGKDVIRYNKVAEAWHDKFDQVMLKGRSLQGDSEFTQQLNYYESKLED